MIREWAIALLAVSLLVGFARPPGALNPAVNQGNIHETVCVPGYTDTIRPPVSYTNRIKRDKIGPNADPKLYELDHVIPLSIGGHPTDPNNLWPQEWTGPRGARAKDVIERRLHRQVCGWTQPTITLREAQRQILEW